MFHYKQKTERLISWLIIILRTKLLYSGEVCKQKNQFNDYSKYDFNLFSEVDKRRYRDEHFPTDLENARQLGKRLVEKAKEQ